MSYTIQSVKQAYALSKGSLLEALARKNYIASEMSHWSKDELADAWLRFYGEVEADPPASQYPYSAQGCDSEPLPAESVVVGTLPEDDVLTDTAGRMYRLADEESLRS